MAQSKGSKMILEKDDEKKTFWFSSVHAFTYKYFDSRPNIANLTEGGGADLTPPV